MDPFPALSQGGTEALTGCWLGTGRPVLWGGGPWHRTCTGPPGLLGGGQPPTCTSGATPQSSILGHHRRHPRDLVRPRERGTTSAPTFEEQMLTLRVWVEW